MLKSITVQNFAYFKDKQTLNFEDGAYFMIGENDSGKTSLFEIIHGCMGASKITRLTKPHNADEPSFALCCFNDDAGNKPPRVLSVLMRWKTDQDEIYLKLVHVRKEQEKLETVEAPEHDLGQVEAEYFQSNADWQPDSFEELRNDLLKELNTSPECISGDKIFDLFKSYFECKSGTQEEARVSGTNGCETFLKKYVNKSTVVTFPMRGISTYQWTKSKCLKPKQQHDLKRYSEEIITWYLKKAVDISDDEKKKENEYFRLITNNSDVEFNLKDNKLVVTKAAFPDEEISILTVSEGIYEAKKLSVLLAVKRFQTVCIEEPDRGMHPQMIERIRDLVLPQIKQGKIVLITTHHPSFLSPSTLPRVYSFRRHFVGNEGKQSRWIATVNLLLSEKGKTNNKCKTQADEDDNDQGEKVLKNMTPKYESTTQEVGDIGHGQPGTSKAQHQENKQGKHKNKEEHEDKTLRHVTSGASPLLFFATKLLLVEGQSDFIFVIQLKQVLMTQDDLLKCFIKQMQSPSVDTVSIKSLLEEIRQFLCSLHIVPMIGEANKGKYFKLCKRIEMLAFFLLDKDALTSNIPSPKSTDRPKSTDMPKTTDIPKSADENKSADGHKSTDGPRSTDRPKLTDMPKSADGNKSADGHKSTDESKSIKRPKSADWPKSTKRPKSSDEPKSKDVQLRGFLKMFDLNYDEDSFQKLKDGVESKDEVVSVLEKDGIFVWNGTMERAAASLTEKNKDLQKFYETNNVDLEYRKLKRGEKPGKKIFSDKQLTNRNISEVVEKIVELSKGDKESEFHRFIMFLIKIRNHYLEHT